MTSPAPASDRQRPSRRVTRVGIVARADLHRAARDLVELGEWLRARGVDAIFEEHTSSLAVDAMKAADAVNTGVPNGESEIAAPDQRTLRLEDMIGAVDMIVLLGGDGTLLGTADRLAM